MAATPWRCLLTRTSRLCLRVLVGCGGLRVLEGLGGFRIWGLGWLGFNVLRLRGSRFMRGLSC